MNTKLVLSLIIFATYHQQSLCLFNENSTIKNFRDAIIPLSAGTAAGLAQKKFNKHFDLSSKITPTLTGISTAGILAARLHTGKFDRHNPILPISCLGLLTSIGLTGYKILNKKMNNSDTTTSENNQ